MHSTHMQCVSMEGSMSCPCFLATSPNSNPTGYSYIFCLHFILFFLPNFQLLVVKCCMQYNVFWYGASHGIYAQFIAQATSFNNKKIGLLQGAGTRFATWFYAIHRVLCQKTAIKAKIHNPCFSSLSKNGCIEATIKDLADKFICKVIYCLLHDMFPALKALRYCNSNIFAVDKIYFLVKQADEALLDPQKVLDDKDLF